MVARAATRPTLIRRAAERLAGEKEQPWSAINAFHFTNRFVESRFVGRAFGFHTREMALPGCHATPFQGHLLRAARREASFAPSYHFVTDLGTRRSLDQPARRPQRKPGVAATTRTTSPAGAAASTSAWQSSATGGIVLAGVSRFAAALPVRIAA